MSYCTKQDLLNRGWEAELIELTDDAGLGVINETVFAQAIADASAEIDSYLQGRYSLPLATPVASLTRLGCDSTRYYLYDAAMTDQVEARYEAVVRYLEQVSNGRIKLGIELSRCDWRKFKYRYH